MLAGIEQSDSQMQPSLEGRSLTDILYLIVGKIYRKDQRHLLLIGKSDMM